MEATMFNAQILACCLRCAVSVKTQGAPNESNASLSHRNLLADSLGMPTACKRAGGGSDARAYGRRAYRYYWEDLAKI